MTQTLKVKVYKTIVDRVEAPILANVRSMGVHELAEWLNQHLHEKVFEHGPDDSTDTGDLVCLPAQDVPAGVPFRKPMGDAIYRRLAGLPSLFPAHAPTTAHIQVVSEDYRLNYIQSTKIVVTQHV